MASVGGAVTVVDDDGTSLVVTLTDVTGAAVTVYTDEGLSSSIAMPATITAATTFWVPRDGTYSLSITESGIQVADTPDAARTVTLSGGKRVVIKPTLDQGRLPDLSGTYAPALGARPGNNAVFLGDSITQSTDQNSTAYQGGSWPNLAAVISGQRIRYTYNAGVSGDTSSQMLARFDTDVTPHKPNVVFLLAGTNDLSASTAGGGSTPVSTASSTFQSNVQAIVTKIRAIGAVPVLCTIPPSDTTAKHGLITEWNTWLRRYGAAQGIAVIDFYTLLVDPTNGNYKSTYHNDGVHPNGAGYLALANLVSSSVSGLLPANTPLLCSDDLDPRSLLYKGTFGGYTGSTVPTGWLDNAGVPTGSTLSYVTDSQVPGQMVQIAQAATTGVRQLAYNQYIGSTALSSSVAAGATSLTLPIRADYGGVLFIGSGSTFEVVKIQSSAGGGPQTETLVSPLLYAHAAGEPVIANAAPGDLLVFSGVLTSDGGVPVTVDTNCVGGSYSPAPYGAVTAAVTRGVFYQAFTVPTGTTQIAYRLLSGSGTGTTSWGRLGVYNLTRMGVSY